MIAWIQGVDSGILLWIQNALRCPPLDVLFTFLTSLGNAGAVWILLSVILLCFPKTRKAGICAIISLAVCFLINNVALKNLVCRPRPFTVVPGLETVIRFPGGWSFPSGHASSSFAAAGALLRTLPQRKEGWALMVLALLIALSRLYVGVHYPTDVLAGSVIGFAVSQLVVYAVTRIMDKKAKE